jgi:hypothetical protein
MVGGTKNSVFRKDETKARCGDIIPALRRLRQEDHKFKASLAYTVKTPPQKNKNDNKNK